MKSHHLVAAVGAACLAFNASAHAAEPVVERFAVATPTACIEAPQSPFRPESEVCSLVESFLRYRVSQVATDAGCYAVLASDRHGTPYEVRFRGTDLKMISRHVVKEAR
jgi:hypothetical protein